VSSPRAFTYEAHPTRVVFGEGSLRRLGGEVDRLGITRALLVGSPRWTGAVQALLAGRVAGTVAQAVPHVPADVAREAVLAATNAHTDGLVAVGGGSATGLAKAVARETALPILAVPTTYSGSEMTSIWGVTESGRKRTGRDDRARPRTAVYDPELLTGLPRAVAGPSGLNALAHAMEALYARDVDPVTTLMAEEAIATIGRDLPALIDDDPQRARGARSGTLYAAWLAGVCLDRAATGVHHKVCHVLGGSFGLPHAATHAVLLPYAAAFNRGAAPEAMRRIARALSAEDAPSGLFALARRVGAPRSLEALGMRQEDLDRAAELAAEGPYGNPRPVDRHGVRALLEQAFRGEAPGEI
jgi:maleylacetate reductase